MDQGHVVEVVVILNSPRCIQLPYGALGTG